MNVASLVDAYNHGVTRVKKDRDTPYATLQMAEVGGQAMSVDTARQLCASLGVVEMYCNPFEELNNLNKYIKEFVKFKNLPQVYANTHVDFMNRRGDLPGSSYNRVHFICPGVFEVSVIIGMKSCGASHVVYDSFTNNAIGKYRTFGKAVEGIISKID